jgi:hypothetical protein
MDAIARTRVPYVGSCGALDMVNFLGHGHGAGVVSRAAPAPPQCQRDADAHPRPMRTRRSAASLRPSSTAWKGPVRFLIPEGGVSGLDKPDGPFWDPAADRALFDALAKDFLPTPNRKLIRLPLHLNDPAFAAALAASFREIEPKQGQPHGPHRAQRDPEKAARQGASPRAHHRGRRRHRPVREMRGGGGIDLIVIYNSGRYRMAGAARWRA